LRGLNDLNGKNEKAGHARGTTPWNHSYFSRTAEEMPRRVGYRMTHAATKSRIIAAKRPLTLYPQRREYGQMGNDARNGRIRDRIPISMGDMNRPAERSRLTLAASYYTVHNSR
jgi:hypothetical protein